MNIMDSECSSGCDSGWTLYFEQSFLSTNPTHDRGNNDCVDEKGVFDEHKQKRSNYDEEEEDLSMVSDASSGPPHFHEVDERFENSNGCYYPASMDATLVKNRGKRQKSRATNQHREVREKHSLLDDTASSPAFNFSKNNYTHTNNNQASMESILDFSQGSFSATHFEGGSAFQSHFGVLQPPMSGNQFQQNQWFGGNRLGMR